MLEDHFDSFWDLTLQQKLAYTVNRTAIGTGVIVGAWHIWSQNWWDAFFIFGVMYPFYFWLHWTVDAP